MQMLESANALQQQHEPDDDEIRLQPPPMAPVPSHGPVAGPSHAQVIVPMQAVVEYGPSATSVPSTHSAREPIPSYMGALPTSGMRSTTVGVTSSYGGVQGGPNVYQHQLPLEQGIPGAQLPASSTFLDEFFSSFMPMDTSADSQPVRPSPPLSFLLIHARLASDHFCLRILADDLKYILSLA